ncbi:MAG: SPOR domain-containing protein [Gemmatimonadales bacterium]|nr:MAG: SPOR domain-containing protein [Gemmatimonadales bacterium]
MANPAEKDANQKPFKTTRRRTMAGWVVAVFFIAAWMFGMGVMVGRETAPVRFDLDQLKKSLESLQKAHRESQKNAPPVESTEMKDKTKLDFYEVLPKNREDADVNLPKPTPPGPASAKAEPPAPKAAEPPAQARTEKPPTVPAAPPAPIAEKPAPPPQAAAVPGQLFTVQVSAVKNEEEARRMVDRLRQRGYAAHVEATAMSDKSVWYRIRMGEFPTKDSARGTVDRLKKDGFGPMVVPK